MLHVEHLTAGYGGLTILRDVSLDVGEREICALIGANGAGKTTLLRAISGRITATGSIAIGTTELIDEPPHARARRGLGHVAEGAGVFRALTVAENLRLFGAGDRLEDILDTFPRLRGRLGQRAGTLSGGEQQMLALSRAWASCPSVLLIDELSLGLATEFVDELAPIVAQLPERGTAVLLVEQHLDLALALADHAVLIQRGETIFESSTADLDRGLVESCLVAAAPAGR